MPNSKPLGEVNLEQLFDQIIVMTEQREAFSPVKEANIGFSAIADMKALRDEFVAAETELELWYALHKLSNVRRDRHLVVRYVEGGLPAPGWQPCVSAPIQVLPDLSDLDNPVFFIAAVGEGLNSPKVGDAIVGVNGRSIGEHITEFSPWIRHSTLPRLYWHLAYELPTRHFWGTPPTTYSDRLHLILESQSAQTYGVSLPYDSECDRYRLTPGNPGFEEVMERQNFNVLLDENREIILLQWLDFEMNDLALVNDVNDLMEYAEKEGILGWDMIIDVTWSSGGSGGAFVIQRLVDQPFRPTFGNVRLSGIGKGLIEYYASRSPNTDAPDIFGLNLSGSWRYDWARTDGREAIYRGDEYTAPVPFKLAHLPKDLSLIHI